MTSPGRRRGRLSTKRSLTDVEGWSKARRDLATPQGSNLMLAVLMCFLCTVVAMIVQAVFDLPESIVGSATIVAYLVIFVIAILRISAMNRRAEEARREAYRRKFESNLEAIRESGRHRNFETSEKEGQ